jgi:hypothetical protein
MGTEDAPMEDPSEEEGERRALTFMLGIIVEWMLGG